MALRGFFDFHHVKSYFLPISKKIKPIPLKIE